MRLTLIFALLFPHVSFAAKPANKMTCTKRELERQDCRLQFGAHSVRLLSETIARDDGVERKVDQMPLKGEGIAWEKMRLDNFQGWPILQMWIWDKGEGEAQVQNLRWYVTDLTKGDLKILNEGVVCRRRQKPIGPEGEPVAKDKPKPKYIVDAWEKHGLSLRKDGALDCHLRDEKKVFERVKKDGV